MYLIALCDDEEVALDKTERILRVYENSHPDISFAIERFQSADCLIRRVREGDYVPNCILMDIYMPGKLGIEAALELRDLGTQAKIIFLTTSRDHALDAFDVEASQYLVKQITDD